MHFIFNTIECEAVNMTSKKKGWPVNFPIRLDIVRSLAIISSPAIDSIEGHK